jgi:uncharacterized protein (DUF2147 family)
LIKHILISVILWCLIITPYAHAVGCDGIIGLWNTEERDAKIEIFKCGQKCCGNIAWLQDPKYPAADGNGKEGQPKADENNPDPKLRDRTITGIQIMNDFSFSGGNTWTGGTIYDPESGSRFRVKMNLSSPNMLDLKGYVIMPIFSSTSKWTRADR